MDDTTREELHETCRALADVTAPFVEFAIGNRRSSTVAVLVFTHLLDGDPMSLATTRTRFDGPRIEVTADPTTEYRWLDRICVDGLDVVVDMAKVRRVLAGRS